MKIPVLAILFAITLPANAERLCVVPGESKFNIKVGSAGLFAAFGHDHQIEARGIQGCAEMDWQTLNQSSVSLVFAAREIVVTDPDHPKDRPEVQETMESAVLQVAKFPEIRFNSTSVRTRRQNDIVVDGLLTILDHTERVSIPLTLRRAAGNKVTISGRYSLKQSTYGIRPVRVMAGTIRVKDEVGIDFEIVLAPAAARR